MRRWHERVTLRDSDAGGVAGSSDLNRHCPFSQPDGIAPRLLSKPRARAGGLAASHRGRGAARRAAVARTSVGKHPRHGSFPRLAGQAARTAALLNGIAGHWIELCEGPRFVSGQAAMRVLPGVLAVLRCLFPTQPVPSPAASPPVSPGSCPTAPPPSYR